IPADIIDCDILEDAYCILKFLEIKHIQNRAPVRDYLTELDDGSNECK
ncbi:9249_t:CDS:2, partial [Racocetra persica]